MKSREQMALGLILTAGSALTWSFGGAIARFITIEDSWTIVFWRSYFGVLTLVLFLVLRDGLPATVKGFSNMGLPGLLVAGCFTVASVGYVVALNYTSVANIYLMLAGVPLFAALINWAIFREKTPVMTWVAICCVIAGVGVMVSGNFNGQVSMVGDAIAFLIAVAFAIATVTTRRNRDIRMVPANALGVLIAMIIAGFLTRNFIVSWQDFAWLAAFGALNLAAGMVLFSFGARMLPAALAALVGVTEPVLGPLWVWLVHGEVPEPRTMLGGAIVIAALLFHLLFEWQSAKRVV